MRGLLVTTAVVGAAKAARAAALAATAPDTIVVADDATVVARARAKRQGGPAVLHVAVDLYFGRTGVPPGEAACASRARSTARRTWPSPACRPTTAAASHTAPFDAPARRAARPACSAAVDTARLLAADGIACPLVTGGSTGTYRIDAEIDGVTELQPGSFLFMDSDYARIGGAAGEAAYKDFRPALTVPPPSSASTATTRSSTAATSRSPPTGRSHRCGGRRRVDLRLGR